jgi:plastocyanin
MSGARLVVPAAVAAVLLLSAAACGGGGDGGQAVATTNVSMAKSYVFEPKRIRVEAGDTVTWTNDDNFTHTVRVDGQEDHRVERGDSVSIAFAEPGTYHYVCTLHRRDMDGEVIVE